MVTKLVVAGAKLTLRSNEEGWCTVDLTLPDKTIRLGAEDRDWVLHHLAAALEKQITGKGIRLRRLAMSERRDRLASMSTPASCLLSRLLSAHRRAGSPPLAAWPVWPETRAERGTFDTLVAQGLLVENGGAWLLTERALSPVVQIAASNRFQGRLRAAQEPAPAGKWAAGS